MVVAQDRIRLIAFPGFSQLLIKIFRPCSLTYVNFGHSSFFVLARANDKRAFISREAASACAPGFNRG